MEEIIVCAREVYGNVLYYPGNEQAWRVLRLTGTITLRARDIKVLREMGHTVEVVR